MSVGAVTGRYAFRSLGRNVRRSSLSVAGIAFGVGIALFGIAWIRGERLLTMRAAAASGAGNLRVVPARWAVTRDPDLRLDDGPSVLRRVRATPGVAVAAPRARTGVLLGLGTRSIQVELTGIDPVVEPRALRFVRRATSGRYLRTGDAHTLVLGQALADRLDAEVGDEIVAMAVDRNGDMQSELLELVGLVRSGSRDIDATIAQTGLDDVASLTGRARIGEITVLVDDVHALDAVQARLTRAAGRHDRVLSWTEVAPEIAAGLATDSAFMNLTVFVVLAVVLLGVAGAQLTTVLERRKELAVLAAVGLRSGGLVGIMLAEATVLGFAGALAALAWSVPLVLWLASHGVDLRAFVGDQALPVGGVLLDPVFYPDFGAWLFPAAVALAVGASVIASFYPAWLVGRTDPAAALRADR